MKFNYVQFRGRFLPIVPIRFKHRDGGWTEFKGYVDSGASYSIFRAVICEILGLNLEEGDKEYITVGDGSVIPVYLHKIIIQIAGKEFKAMIGFSRRLGIGFNILGRKDIFERFKVCFDERERTVEFVEK